MSAGYKWRPLQRATVDSASTDPTLVAAYVARNGGTAEEARAAIDASHAECEYWINDLYQVEVRRAANEASAWICIRRRDGYPGRDWRHFQQIKNEIVGPECEAVELYPAESRLTDTSNKYHLFACTDPDFRFPFGYRTRDVSFDQYDRPGLRQRPPMKVDT